MFLVLVMEVRSNLRVNSEMIIPSQKKKLYVILVLYGENHLCLKVPLKYILIIVYEGNYVIYEFGNARKS